MKTVYVLSKYLTFPGSFSKGFLEHAVCRMLGVNIYAADKYVSRNALSGHVAMLPPPGAVKSFFVCFLPGLFNLAVGAVGYLCALAALGLLGVGYSDTFSGSKAPLFFVYCFLFWFCGSFMCNLFPYREDALHLWKLLYAPGAQAKPLVKILLFIPSVIITAGAYLEKYGLTLLMNGALAVWIFFPAIKLIVWRFL